MIDVVIPLYNCAPFIETTIRSVQHQTVPVRKIIVVNDGSTDGGEKKVAAMAATDERICVLNGPNRGLSAARNLGIQIAKARYLAFLDADDAWEPEKVASQLAVMDKGDFSFSHTGARLMDESGKPMGNVPFPIQTTVAPTFENIRLGIYPVTGSGSSVMVRRELLERAGGFDEKLRFGEDWDMWARLAQFGPAIRLDQPLTWIRVRQSSMQHSLSAEKRALCQLDCRIHVARHWENEPAFLQAHKKEACYDLWAVMRWRLLRPSSLLELYRHLHLHPYAAGRILARHPGDFLHVLGWGCAETVRSILHSPSEAKRLLRRFLAERRRK
ncbi:glycosyltransferase family A protein [uncultured Desulfovibrio sp.]|uniref:Glycosyltransferase family 2 protein n=1 Tax=Candidatus Desulfovibrio intestinavium TaxID=2838534 RepID=A0A9D2KRU6_9BACT|nr:glycosyltransferase family A protein [uncultured Desulfovibrio sp.]HJA78766.1 glycosyltransferase family 2 protein [Candidatus Desulfovibrio intestinavium]